MIFKQKLGFFFSVSSVEERTKYWKGLPFFPLFFLLQTTTHYSYFSFFPLLCIHSFPFSFYIYIYSMCSIFLCSFLLFILGVGGVLLGLWHYFSEKTHEWSQILCRLIKWQHVEDRECHSIHVSDCNWVVIGYNWKSW